MKLTFLIPPALDGKQPAERTAGCTRVVYVAPNIYELTVMALLEESGYKNDLHYRDFIYANEGKESFEKFLSEDKSDVYYIWAVNLSLDNDALAIELIRKYNPKAKVVFIGPGPTYFTSKCIKGENDYVVRGEPDLTVLELTNALRDGSDLAEIKGISYFKDGKIVNNPPRALMRELDLLPLPARHFIADKRYHNPKLKIGPYTTAVTSRNCPYRCIYCVPSSLTFAREIEYKKENGTKPPISFKSTARIAEEMKTIAAAGYKAVGFMDDNFIWNKQRTREICTIMQEYGLLWGCQARVDAITDEIAKMLGESGCKYVDLGVESFDDEILKYVKKGITSEQIFSAIKSLKKYKVPVKLNILIGCSPLETKETIKRTLATVKKLNVDQVMFNIVSPFPGTEYYKLCKENGWIGTDNGEYVPTDVQRESILNFPHLTSKEMERLLYKNNLSYFLSPKFIWKQMKRFSSWEEFTYALKALKIKLFG
ncbi:MAG: radical SAM protein [Bacteroidales bacterium]|nr:radical SAM protein [Bacteroidales bacterium]